MVLVPDEIVLELLENRIKQDDAKKGFILDGYPRNIKQVDSLIKLFNELNINDYVVIYLDVDYEEAMHRTLGRMICSNCKSSFNKFKEATRPKVDGICDFCGADTQSRRAGRKKARYPAGHGGQRLYQEHTAGTDEGQTGHYRRVCG